MTGEQEVSVDPGVSGNVVTFSRILRHLLDGIYRWMESAGEVASSDRYHISDCG